MSPDICMTKGFEDPTIEILDGRKISDHSPILLSTGLITMSPPETVIGATDVQSLFMDVNMIKNLMGARFPLEDPSAFIRKNVERIKYERVENKVFRQ